MSFIMYSPQYLVELRKRLGGSLKLVNGVILGTKYGMVDLGDYNYVMSDAGTQYERAVGYILPNAMKECGDGNVANLYTGKYTTTSAGATYLHLQDKTISAYGSLTTYFAIYDSLLIGKTASEVKSLLKGQYLIYELATPNGTFLNNYTAEQIYNLLTFNGTDFTDLELLADGYEVKLNNNKQPKGIELQCGDNTIINTKYGIVDLGDCSWAIYGSGGSTERAITSNISSSVKKGSSTSDIANIYLGYYTTTAYNTLITHSVDKCVALDTNGNVFVYNSAFIGKTASEVKASLKGQYLIYELATPNGTDYNDLTAEQMYNLINDDTIEILANGKTIRGGISSVIGKCNNQSFSSPSTSGGYMITLKNDNTFIGGRDTNLLSNESTKKVNLIANHKYYIAFMCQTTNVYTSVYDTPMLYNGTTIRGQSFYSTTEVASSVVQPTSTSDYLVGLSNYHQYWTSGDKLFGAIVVDLTQANLSTMNAQQCYNYFKSKNLYDLINSGVIYIGGD